MQFGREAHISGKPRKRVLSKPGPDRPEAYAVVGGSLHDQTTENLRELIVEGDFEPGARLVEADMCRRLGVSRTPLREALKVLAGEGLVDLQPNRGARVARMSAAGVADLFEVIAHLEALAAELACKRMTASELLELEAMHVRMMEWHASGRRQDYFEINDRIHRAIVARAGNQILTATHEQLIARARRMRYQALHASGRWDQSVAEHVAVMDAFARRDGKAAGRIWRRHVLATGALIAAQVPPVDAGDETW